MQTSDLPCLDEHATTIEAPGHDVWRGLLETLDVTFSGSRAHAYARLVGCVPVRSAGPRPLAVGSTVVGFEVTTAMPGRELVLQGRHRFSTYALVFRIDELGPDRSRLRAQTRAVFPGAAGAIYRQLLLRTSGHVLGVRRLLSGVRHRAERR